MGAFFEHSELASVQGITSTTWALALVAVVLRFTARRISKAGLWYDDYMTIFALIGGLGLWLNAVIWMSAINQGPSYDVYPIIGILKCNYIANLVWTVAISSTKLSILFLYIRLFTQLPKSLWIIRILFYIVICWAVISMFIHIFACKPISDYWESETEENCPMLVHSHGQTIITHVVIDILILAAPIPMMLGLELHLKQKLMLCGIFSLGGFVTIVSGLRLKYILVDTGNDTWRSIITKAVIWTCVEVNTAIVCACLPCLRLIASYIEEKLKALRHRKRPVRQGTELLVEMLPRREQQQVFKSTSLHETPEIDTAHEQISLEPQEIDTAQRLLPEMAAIERGPFELPSLDIGPTFGALRRDFASDIV